MARIVVTLDAAQQKDIFQSQLEALAEDTELVGDVAYQVETSHHNGDRYRGDVLVTYEQDPVRFEVIKAAHALRYALRNLRDAQQKDGRK
jgi:hypothetical protein